MLKLNKLLGENEQNKIHDKNLQYDREGKEQNAHLLVHLAFCSLEELKVTTYYILKKLGTTPKSYDLPAFCISKTYSKHV